ncbi:MAG: hypothetical protein AAFN10_02695 [Bacteroidota bacterium]
MKAAFTYPPIAIVSFICLSLLLGNCSPIGHQKDAEHASETVFPTQKQKGTHLFSVREGTDFAPFRQSNLEWLTVVPWGFQIDIDSPEVSHHDGDSLHIKQHEDNWVGNIRLARAAGFKVFLKPHLWLNAPREGKWRSDIYPADEKVWEEWQLSYTEFILRYARVAEAAEAEMFCIGTEFSLLSVKKADFWRALIKQIRQVYSGKITYAANWYDEFAEITFWDQLDYIGIQAYFPLVEHNYPTVAQLTQAWDKHLPAIKAVSQRYERQILFTEMGYRSTANSAIKPWEWMEKQDEPDSLYSPETQANCYQAFFDVFWQKDWFAGVHIWQMRSDFVAKPGKKNLDFSPQGKLAEQVIAKGFE